MSKLIVFTYDTEEKAQTVLDKVVELSKKNLVEIRDAAWVVKDADGKVNVKQTLEDRVKGGNIISGGFWGLLIGFFFGGPLFGALLGMGLSAIFGTQIDIGIDNDFMKEVGNDMSPRNSALFLLAGDITVDKLADELKSYGGNIYHTSLSKESEEMLRKALDNKQIAEAVRAEHGELTTA